MNALGQKMLVYGEPSKGYLFRVFRSLSFVKKISIEAARPKKMASAAGKVVRARWDIPFMHLEISLPFGEQITPEVVHKELQEKMGGGLRGYSDWRWYGYYDENTSRGTLHRGLVFMTDEETGRQRKSPEISADLVEAEVSGAWSGVADVELPVEAGIFALGQRYQEESGATDFHCIFSSRGKFYSLVTLKGLPYHLGKYDGDHHGLALLKAQREWACKFHKNEMPLVTLQEHVTGLPPSWEKPVPYRLASLPGESQAPLLLSGVLLAATLPDFKAHNRTDPEMRRQLQRVRERRSMVASLTLGVLGALALAAWGGTALAHSKREVSGLQELAKKHEARLTRIESHRKQKERLIASVEKFRPVWQTPVPWHVILNEIARVLPSPGGLRGLLIKENDQGGMEVHFNAWVKSWDDVNAAQKALEQLPFFEAIQISDQKRHAQKNEIAFQVSCKLRQGS